MPSLLETAAESVANVVNMAPSSVTNITGLRAIDHGFSILTAWPTDGSSILAVKSDFSLRKDEPPEEPPADIASTCMEFGPSNQR